MSALVAVDRRLRRRLGRHPAGYGPYTNVGASCRVVGLYLVSRCMVHSLVALAAVVFMVWWLGRDFDPAQIENPMVIPRDQTLIVHFAAAMLASVVGIALWTPFGETERVSPIVLPVMRALHLMLLLVIGLAGVLMVIRTWPEVMPEIVLGWLLVRNTLFLTGCVLLIGKALDVRLAWLVPVLLAGVTAVAILQRVPEMASPAELWHLERWNILGQDQTNGVANAVCIGVVIGATAAYIRDGVRDTDEAE